ncbi:MAG: hypothetical protein [Wendovervirus sonii]|uniref:Uncharacterized protein n=1 Tax=phage Lak_Megaphage_Sonny TaxID=3109229 RepID=A0ABZ0Z239_9CAUD|nr:MAG: hypothetical protein [phage Lak_Megaphage_Sonny]
MEKNYTGYENCLRIYNVINDARAKYKESYMINYGKTPAIDYCLNLKENNYQGYLPSIGQLKIMSDNIHIINYIFKYLNFQEINWGTNYWWASIEHSDKFAWPLTVNTISNTYSKYYEFKIFPLFAHMKNVTNL